MEYEKFKSLIELCLTMYKNSIEKDEQLQEVLGGETQLMLDMCEPYISEIIKSLDNKFELVEWFFWEVLIEEEPNKTIIIDEDTEVKATMENIWKLIYKDQIG